jgi:hypothetical protein
MVDVDTIGHIKAIIAFEIPGCCTVELTAAVMESLYKPTAYCKNFDGTCRWQLPEIDTTLSSSG